ncbi:MAG: hypothetical protein FWC89_12810 [Defluviitaleaceae bacterium]|nr:hypothetical protein [Defluviitaleaceae bacterium]
MKNLIKIGLFAVVAGLALSCLPMRVPALAPHDPMNPWPPPRTARVNGVEGYKVLLLLADAPNAEVFDAIRAESIDEGLIEDQGSLLWVRRNEFIATIEAQIFPILRGEELGWLEYDELHNMFSGYPLWKSFTVDDIVYDFFITSWDDKHVEEMEITQLPPPSSNPNNEDQVRVSYQINKGNHEIQVCITSQNTEVSIDNVLALFDFKTMEELVAVNSANCLNTKLINKQRKLSQFSKHQAN